MKFKPTKPPKIPLTLVISLFEESRDSKTFITLLQHNIYAQTFIVGGYT